MPKINVWSKLSFCKIVTKLVSFSLLTFAKTFLVSVEFESIIFQLLWWFLTWPNWFHEKITIVTTWAMFRCYSISYNEFRFFNHNSSLNCETFSDEFKVLIDTKLLASKLTQFFCQRGMENVCSIVVGLCLRNQFFKTCT